MIRQTSIDVYNKIKDDGTLSQRRFQAYDILYSYGPLTGGEVAVKMREIYGIRGVSESVRNRLTELRQMGCIDECGQIQCSVTGNQSILWDVNGKYPTKLVKKKKPREWWLAFYHDGVPYLCKDRKPEVMNDHTWVHVREVVR